MISIIFFLQFFCGDEQKTAKWEIARRNANIKKKLGKTR